MIKFDKDRNEKIISLLYEAGKVQGSHHKAWYIDQLARLLLDDYSYKVVSQQEDWEKGIAP